MRRLTLPSPNINPNPNPNPNPNQKHPEAAARGAVGGQCRKLEALAEQVQSNAPMPGSGKKANKKQKA